jgi:hypothetical protein
MVAVGWGIDRFAKAATYFAGIDIESDHKLDITQSVSANVGIHQTDRLVMVSRVVLHSSISAEAHDPTPATAILILLFTRNPFVISVYRHWLQVKRVGRRVNEG